MTQSHLSAPTGTLISSPDPSELPAAISVARRMLAAYDTVDYGNVVALGQAYGALSESLRILLRTVDQTVEQHHYDQAAQSQQHEPVGSGCGAPATTLIEGYSPRNGLAHGNLDLTVYACDEHAGTARAEWVQGLTPYSMTSRSQQRCGELFDYTIGGAR